MKKIIILLVTIGWAQIAHAAAQIGQIPEAGPSAYILCLEYSFDDENAFTEIDLRKDDRLSGRMLSETRSWIRDRTPKGKYLGVFLISAKKSGVVISEADIKGLPAGTKFDFSLNPK